MADQTVARDASHDASGADTFPRLLLRHAAARPDAPALREKDLGIWQTVTWSQLRDEVAALSAGLASQGFQRGQNLDRKSGV